MQCLLQGRIVGPYWCSKLALAVPAERWSGSLEESIVIAFWCHACFHVITTHNNMQCLLQGHTVGPYWCSSLLLQCLLDSGAEVKTDVGVAQISLCV